MAAAGADIAGTVIPAQPEGESDAPKVTSRVGTAQWILVGSSYLALGILIWSRIWFGHPTSVTMCGCRDNAGAIWVVGWPAYAISHGINPFHTTAVFYPTGMNLLANAGVLAIGIPLAPVTWIFGPVASFNVAATLGPVLSALAMFALLRRWVAWTPAAYIGGLLYGFSPFELVSNSMGWINLGTLVVPPLIVLCLDELLFRQTRRPMLTAILLGLLTALQFFISTEVLVIVALVTLAGLTLIVLYSMTDIANLRERTRAAWRYLLAAAATAAVLLAYPVWFALQGPSHFTGKVWPSSTVIGGTNLRDFAVPNAPTPPIIQAVVGGYQGDSISAQYVGIGLLVVVLAGMVIWWRDRRLWLFGAIAGFSALISLGAPVGEPLPWSLLAHAPFFENVIPGRFVLVVYLCLAVMLGLVLDHAHSAVERRSRATDGGTPKASGSGRPSARRVPWPGIITLGLAAVAIVPLASYESTLVPMTVRPVVLPTWFRTSVPPPTSHQVLLVLPLAFILEGSLTWQAVDGYSYSMIGGTGPQSVGSRAGAYASGQAPL